MCLTLAMMLPVPILVVCPSAGIDLSKINAVIQALGYRQEMVLYAHHENEATLIIEKHLPNLILYIITDPTHVSFISKLKQKKYSDHFIAVIVIESAPLIYSALVSGIDSYILLEQPIEQMSETLKIALRGGAYVHADVANYLLQQMNLNPILKAKINAKEQQLLALFAQNMPLSEILNTVQMHDFQIHHMIHNIYRKISA